MFAKMITGIPASAVVLQRIMYKLQTMKLIKNNEVLRKLKMFTKSKVLKVNNNVDKIKKVPYK